MKKRVAVVTGTSRGIGKAVAQELKKRGFTVVGLTRKECDVRHHGAVEFFFEKIYQKYKRVDVLVNCSAIVTFSKSLDINQTEWEDVLQTNLLGSYYTCREAIKIMKKKKYGRIVNMSSIAGRLYTKTASLAYTASKYAVIGLTRQLAVEFGKFGINVNCVCPSQTRTETLKRNVPKAKQKKLASQNPLGRLAEPAEIAKAVSLLVGDEVSYINGAVLDVNGGQL